MIAAAAIAYVALMTLWIYGVFETDAYYDEWWIPLLVLLNVGVGYAIGHWWAVALAAVVPLLAIPAGTANNAESPASLLLLWFAAGLAGLLAIGVVLRRRRPRRQL